MRRLSLGSLLCLLLMGCGGGEAPASKTADDEPAQKRDQGNSGAAVSAEIGGLNEDEVDATFTKAMGSLQKCLASGAKRVEFLGGSVKFFLKIDASGSVDHAHLEQSTIGDRATEKCMLEALRQRSWPKPVGGEHGLARKSFEFDPPNDVRPPTEWSSDEAAKGLDKIATEVRGCNRGKSGFEATLYVGTDGNVLAAGVTPPDEDGEQNVDCLVDALKSANFPSPGSWPAKVTLSL